MNKVNVIIPMSGKSRRFSESGYVGPKALLNVGNNRMIEHVVNMFDPTLCKYHIIINKDQLEANSNLPSYLNQLALNVEVIVIDSHELGPVHSILQVKNINDDEDIIISYCDFIVEWNYLSFLRNAQGNDGCIVSFKGFHPASLGSTYYAYMRVKDGNMLQLREKKSFTNNRSEEHASAGIYYFKNHNIFQKYAKECMDKDNNPLPEAYVSLLYNDMVKDKLLITVYEANKFICLGTPEDYEQYQFWWNFFTKRQKQQAESNLDIKRIGLIPMAGKGSRFQDYGYRVAKPLIKIGGKPMVIRTAESIPKQNQWIFLPRKEDTIKHPVERALKNFSSDCIIKTVDKLTTGQAATCILAENYIDNDAELIISSADYEHRYNEKMWDSILNDRSIDGAIWTYRCKSMVIKDPESFAYCLVKDDGLTIDSVVEKKTISDMPHLDPLVVGTFWYRNAGDFKEAANHLIDNNITVNGEHYIGTSINYLIKKGRKFIIFDIDQWISFGDPLELKILEYWGEYFYNKTKTI